MKKTIATIFAAIVLFGAYGAQAQFIAVCNVDFDGQYFQDQPEISSALCETGAPSQTIEGDGSIGSPWKWHCFDDQGNEGNRCEAFFGTCGDGVITGSEQCDGEAGCNDSCEMTATCNADFDGRVLSEIPSGELCSIGAPLGDVSGTGTAGDPWFWGCADTAGNLDASCSATQALAEEPDVTELPEVIVEIEAPANDPSGEVGTPGTTTQEEVIAEVTTPAESTPQAVCDASDYGDIKGRIWHDDNQNGERDEGEEGIEDVLVELLDEDGRELEQDDTSDEGKFAFRDYAPGRYTIDVKKSDEQLDDYHIVYEPDANFNEKDQIRLKCNDNHTGTSFGYDTEPRTPQGRPSTLSKTGGSFWSWALSVFEG